MPEVLDRERSHLCMQDMAKSRFKQTLHPETPQRSSHSYLQESGILQVDPSEAQLRPKDTETLEDWLDVIIERFQSA